MGTQQKKCKWHAYTYSVWDMCLSQRWTLCHLLINLWVTCSWWRDFTSKSPILISTLVWTERKRERERLREREDTLSVIQ